MSYMQKRFSQNICRVCKKTFCCETCRIKHEDNEHNIFPNCDICMYGRTYSSRVLQVSGLLEHIREQHWPLHCLYCKCSYSTINEIIEHSKCPVGPITMDITNAKTPIRSVSIVCGEYVDSNSNFNSPPIGILINSVEIGNIFGTSTPTQDGDIDHKMFPETITPVDNTERKRENECAKDNISMPASNEEIQKNKRRVTFNETPQTENIHRLDKLHGIKETLKNCEPQKLCLKEDSSIIIENEVGLEKCNNEVMSVELSDNKENDVKDKPVAIKKRRSSGTGDTIWQSAMENQLQVYEEGDDSFKRNFPESINVKKEKEESNPSFSYVSESQYSIVNNSNYLSGTSMEDCSDMEKVGGIWSSMAFLVKNMVKNFGKGVANESINSNKRHHSDSEAADMDDARKLKRIKLTEIKCRPPIRNVRKFKLVKRSVEKVDKATQTEDEIYITDQK